MTTTTTMHPRRGYAIAALLTVLAAGGALALYAALASAPREVDAATRAVEQAATPPGMVYIPGGAFWSGTDDPDADEDARPRRRVYVPSFYMDRTEVTNREYRRFRPAHTYPSGEDDYPVTNIVYDDAAAYAAWAGKRLPTEAEWEKAARGTDGRRYPWGDGWDPARVPARTHRAKTKTPATRAAGTCLVTPATRVQRIGAHPEGASPYGCLDMAGNAWEWVQGFHRGNPEQRIIRGGAVGYGERACRAYHRAIEGAGVT
jgi:formylglycine-generating enzyme required for sulfatase activity